jgi:chromate transporter
MSLPGAALTYAVSRLWTAFRDRPWRRRIQHGIAPLTVGLVACTAWIMAGLADRTTASAALTLASALIALRSRANPLWLLAGGALLGAAGWL